MSTKLRVFQTHEDGDLLIRFVLEPSSRDTELAKKFGEPEIEVGGTFFEAATLAAPTISPYGVIQAVDVDSEGSANTYSPEKDIVIEATGTTGSGAEFSAVLTPEGTIGSITVLDGGTGYSNDTVVSITSGDHVTNFPLQKVKLWSGFPFTRRINTIPPSDSSLAALALLYVTDIQTKVVDALTTLRDLDTPERDLTKESVYQP